MTWGWDLEDRSGGVWILRDRSFLGEILAVPEPFGTNPASRRVTKNAAVFV